MSNLQREIRPEFWKKYPLDQLNHSEWEALCDGCGLCCLVKLEDEDTQEIAYTKVACKLLDCTTGYCQHYAQRKSHVPDCIEISMENLHNLYWLPVSCAYKRLAEGKAPPSWHYLNTGSKKSIIKAKKSVAGRCISETMINDDIEDYIVRWVK